MVILELSEREDLLKPAIDFFWKCWGNEKNNNFYRDCIENSLDHANTLPKFYLAIKDDQIIGSYALLVNDLVSRQDLMPYLACLFVKEEFRKQGVAEKLLEHGTAQAAAKGFANIYLCTDLVNFYERKGWSYLCDGYGTGGGIDKIYVRSTT